MTDVPYGMRDREPTTDSFLSVDRTHYDQRGSFSMKESNAPFPVIVISRWRLYDDPMTT
jgi:hypothetical protein